MQGRHNLERISSLKERRKEHPSISKTILHSQALPAVLFHTRAILSSP